MDSKAVIPMLRLSKNG